MDSTIKKPSSYWILLWDDAEIGFSLHWDDDWNHLRFCDPPSAIITFMVNCKLNQPQLGGSRKLGVIVMFSSFVPDYLGVKTTVFQKIISQTTPVMIFSLSAWCFQVVYFPCDEIRKACAFFVFLAGLKHVENTNAL